VPLHSLAEAGCQTVNRLTSAEGARERAFDLFVELGVGDAHVTSYGPGEVDEGHDGLEALHAVVLVTFHGQLVLLPSEWSDVPRYVVTPTLHRQTPLR